MPTAKENSKPREPIPAGIHQAICYGVVDLGTQPPNPNSQFQTDPAHKVMLMFEFPEERIQLDRDGERVDLPRALSKEYTLSLHKKAGLRAALVSWRGRQFTEEELKGFDLKNVLGANCMINITHNDKGYEVVNAITPLAKGMPKRAAENELVLFDVGDSIPGTIPEWIKKKILGCEELRNGSSNGHGNDDEPPPPDDDDIPF